MFNDQPATHRDVGLPAARDELDVTTRRRVRKRHDRLVLLAARSTVVLTAIGPWALSLLSDLHQQSSHHPFGPGKSGRGPARSHRGGQQSCPHQGSSIDPGRCVEPTTPGASRASNAHGRCR
eukprot:2464599-Prymnesium_polylepis.2